MTIKKNLHLLWSLVLSLCLIVGAVGTVSAVEYDFVEDQVTTGYRYPSTLFVDDINLDGRIDILSGSRGDDVMAWWEQLADETYTKHQITDSSFSTGHVASADLDGDGDIDVIGAENGTPYEVAWFENTGEEVFTKHVLSAYNTDINGFYVADVKGNELPDLLTTSHDGALRLWTNLGGSFTLEVLDTSLLPPTKVAAVDGDGDGDLDVMVSMEPNDTLVWYENLDEGFSTRQNLVSDFDGESEMDWIDLDQDGDWDVVGRSNTTESQLVWWENDGSMNLTPHQITSLPSNRVVPTGIDFDKDGDIDLVVSEYINNRVVGYANDGTQNFTQSFVIDTYHPSQQKIADINNDGKLDVVTASWDGWYVSVWRQLILNTDPVVDAGDDTTVDEGSDVWLHGSAFDADGDDLSYAWDLDGDNIYETEGKDALFDASDLDGPSEYLVKLKVDDGNNGIGYDQAIVTVENVAPIIETIEAPIDPVNIEAQTNQVKVWFSDAGVADQHTVSWDWGDGETSSEPLAISPAEASHTYTEAGVYPVTIKVEDDDGGIAVTIHEYIVIFNADGGFVTGGGWINSGDDGKANFGFVSRYKKGAQIPSGTTEFNFKAADLNFHSQSYDWLVVNQSGDNAQFKGSGLINGETAPNGDYYKFMLWAQDLDPTATDTLRMKIWYEENGVEQVVYDTGENTNLGGGNITVHN